MRTDVERRKHERIKLTSDTFAYLRRSQSESIMAVKLLDISDKGLGVEHVGDEVCPHTEVELDIVLPAGEDCLQELYGITIYDRMMQGSDEDIDPKRHCGIGFQNLTVSQKAYVRSLLRYFRQN
jgi:hypothetical protein